MSILVNPYITKYQFFPPFSDDVDFENFITDYFNHLYNTYSFDRFGRRGQKQHGLDVYSIEKKTVIQCKCKIIDKSERAIVASLLRELDDDYCSFVEYNKNQTNKFHRFIFATTFKSDTHIATRCNQLSSDSLIVEYWSWDKLLTYINNEVLVKYYSVLLDCTEAHYLDTNNDAYQQAIVINKDQPLLDQIYNFAIQAYDELNYLPLHFFHNQYPFKVSEKFYAHHSIFSLYTENEELVELFRSIKVKPDGSVVFKKKQFINGVEDFENKTIKVLSALTRNSIYYIRTHSGNIVANTFYKRQERCNCIKCRFSRFELKETFDSVNEIPASLDEKFKLAYLNYEIGNFAKSATMFFGLLPDCKDKPILQYIVYYNLSHLLRFIRNNYWGAHEPTELIDKLQEIDLTQQLNRLAKATSKRVLDFIHREQFFHNSFLSIQRTAKNIKAHYFSQLQGGWSSNSEVQKIISSYAHLTSFLNRNYILYEHFTEFGELVDTFIEGIFASHAIDSRQASRLQNLDDFIINNIVYHGNADNIIKYFNRYHLKELKYKRTAPQGYAFEDIILTFLGTSKETWKSFNHNCEEANHHFSNMYGIFFRNFLLMAALCHLPKTLVNKIIQKLLVFLSGEIIVPSHDYKFLRTFIIRQGHMITKRNLVDLLRTCLNNGKTHREQGGVLEAIAMQIKDNHDQLNLPKNDFEKLYRISFEGCEVCNSSHSPLLIIPFYHAIRDPNQRDRILNGIKKYLENHFNAQIYYEAAIFDVLPIIPEYFDQFLEHAKPNPNRVSFRAIFESESPEEKRFPELNMFINLCFKYEINLNDDKYNALRGINDYYDWLLDMENFNYHNFDPRWVSEYSTKFYFCRIGKHSIIKTKVFSYLKENNNRVLERDFVLIFGIQ